MSVYVRTQSMVAACLGLLTMAGCSGDPASQEPVKVQSGLYAVSVSGSGFAQLAQKKKAGGKGDDRICLLGDDLGKLRTLVRENFALEATCSPKLEPRVGNAVTGKLSCPIIAGAGVDTSFEASLAVDAINLDGEMLWYGPAPDGAEGKSEETIGFTLTAKRVRDCT
jgi:hypothetical protein